MVSWSHSSNSFLQQIRLWLSDGFIRLGTCIVLPGSVSLSETRDFNPQPGAVAGAVKSLLIPRHRSLGCDLCADLSTSFHTRVGEGGEHCQKALKSSALAFSANLSWPEPAELLAVVPRHRAAEEAKTNATSAAAVGAEGIRSCTTVPVSAVINAKDNLSWFKI